MTQKKRQIHWKTHLFFQVRSLLFSIFHSQSISSMPQCSCRVIYHRTSKGLRKITRITLTMSDGKEKSPPCNSTVIPWELYKVEGVILCCVHLSPGMFSPAWGRDWSAGPLYRTVAGTRCAVPCGAGLYRAGGDGGGGECSVTDYLSQVNALSRVNYDLQYSLSNRNKVTLHMVTYSPTVKIIWTTDTPLR